MHEPAFEPDPDFKVRLTNATPNPSDFVLYCKSCAWIGTPNAAHAQTTRCPACRSTGIRIWEH